MLVACRLAGLSALEAHYAGVDANAQMLGHLNGHAVSRPTRLPVLRATMRATRRQCAGVRPA